MRPERSIERIHGARLLALSGAPAPVCAAHVQLKHGGFKVVGETLLKLFTIHVVGKGKPLYDYVK